MAELVVVRGVNIILTRIINSDGQAAANIKVFAVACFVNLVKGA